MYAYFEDPYQPSQYGRSYIEVGFGVAYVLIVEQHQVIGQCVN